MTVSDDRSSTLPYGNRSEPRVPGILPKDSGYPMKNTLWHYLSQAGNTHAADVANEVANDTDAPQTVPWLDALTLTQDGSTLTVTFPHAFFGGWFATNRRQLFEKAVSACYPCISSLIYKEAPRSALHPDSRDEKKDLLSQREEQREDRTGKRPKENAKAPTKKNTKAHAAAQAKQSEDTWPPNFLHNEKNTFLVAALAKTLKDTSHAASLVLLHGQSGTGKTLLMKALADELVARGRAIYFADPETYADHTRFLKPSLFWQEYSAFFLDDMQDIAPSKAKQHILLHLLDTAREAKSERRQIFLAASRSAPNLDLEPRLISRLAAGLTLEVHPPDLDVRIRYLQKHCDATSLRITRKQIVLLARKCTQFRQLQGAVEKIKVLAGLHKKTLSQLDIDLVLQSDIGGRIADHNEIIDAVSRATGVSSADILSKKRKADCVLARQVSMFLCRNKLGLSYSELGRLFGKKDHSTVLYAIQKIESLAEQDTDMRRLLNDLEKTWASFP